MNFFKGIKILTLSFLLAGVMSIGNFALALEDSNYVTIDIIAFNDFHGQVEASSRTIGSARFAQAVLDEALKNPNTIVLSAGDEYMGSAMSNILRGLPVAHMKRIIGVEAAAVGNHEFTWGIEQINIWSEIMEAPFLAANIHDIKTNEPVTWAKPYIILEVDGVNVGILGLSTVRTPYQSNRENVEGLIFLDPVETTERYVPIMQQEGADIIVLLTHIATYQDDETGEITFEEGAEGLVYVDGVDVLITGHSHRVVYGHVNGVAVVQGEDFGDYLSRVEIIFDRDTSQVVETIPYVIHLHEFIDEIEKNEEMQNILEKFSAEVNEALSEVIGVAPYSIEHPTRRTLTPLGQWTAEKTRAAAGTQIAFQNPGGIRTDLEAGDITVATMHQIFPFDNYIVVLEMTGSQVIEVLEYGIENDFGRVQFAGLIVEYVSDAPEGQRVVSVTLEDGTPLDPNGVYTVSTNDFMFSGGDGFSMFEEAELVTRMGLMRDYFVEAVREEEVVLFTPPEVLINVGEFSSQSVSDASTANLEENAVFLPIIW